MQRTQPLVFKAEGRAQGHPLVLEAFEAQADVPAWWPARLTIGEAPSARSFNGRVHGLDGKSSITFSALVERRGERNIHANLLSIRFVAGAAAVEAVFVPPLAAAQIKTLVDVAARLDSKQGQAARARALALRESYGESVTLTPVINFAPESQRSAAARRADSSPGA